MKTLIQVDDVIDMFDGPAKTARWARVTTNAVCLWRHRGIPPSIHLRLLVEAMKRGYLIGPDLVSLPSDEWIELYRMMSAGEKPPEVPAE